MLRRFITALLPLLAIAAVWAASTNGTQTANLSWTAPTAYTDNSVLPPGDIAFYTISWQGPAGTSQSKTVAAPALTTTVTGMCGAQNFTITITTTATAAYPSATSSPGGPVPFVSSVNCVPNAPSNFKVS